MQGLLLLIVALYILWLAGSGKLGKLADAWRTIERTTTDDPAQGHTSSTLPTGGIMAPPPAVPQITRAGLPGLLPAQAPATSQGWYNWNNSGTV